MTIPNQLIPTVYEMSRKVYDKELTLTDASAVLSEKHGMNSNSARAYINNFRNMMDGKGFKRTLNAFSMEYYVSTIKEQFGEEQLSKALKALHEHILYYEGTHKGQLKKLRAVHAKYSNSKNL